jgi:predicted transposase YdaD
MSDTQQATPEQQERMQAAIVEAQQRAIQEAQQNLQIELQMRNNSLSFAVNANAAGTDPTIITKAAQVFLEFLKKGEA